MKVFEVTHAERRQLLQALRPECRFVLTKRDWLNWYIANRAKYALGDMCIDRNPTFLFRLVEDDLGKSSE